MGGAQSMTPAQMATTVDGKGLMKQTRRSLDAVLLETLGPTGFAHAMQTRNFELVQKSGGRRSQILHVDVGTQTNVSNCELSRCTICFFATSFPSRGNSV